MSRLEADTIAKKTADPARALSTDRLIRGAVKAWAKADTAVATAVILNSHNVSSLLDRGTGDWEFNFAAAFSNVHFAPTSSATWAGASARPGWAGPIDLTAWVATSSRVMAQQPHSYANMDPSFVSIQAIGDLA